MSTNLSWPLSSSKGGNVLPPPWSQGKRLLRPDYVGNLSKQHHSFRSHPSQLSRLRRKNGSASWTSTVRPSTRSRLLGQVCQVPKTWSVRTPFFYFDCLGDSHEEQLPVQPHVCCQFCGSTSNHEGSEGHIWISISCCILSFPPNPRYRQLFRNSARQPWNKSTTLMTWTPQPSMPKKTLTPWMFWTQTKPSRDCPSWPISPRPGWNTNVVPNEPRHRTFAGEQLGMLVRGLSRFMPVPHNCQTFSVHKP